MAHRLVALADGQASALVAGFDYNSDGPLVLCLHGFPDTAQTFQSQLTAFKAAGYRVLAPMLRGYELCSLSTDHNYRLDSLVKDIPAILDDLGEQRAFLIGHDWGAAIAYLAAARYPDRIRGLVTLALPYPPRLRPLLHTFPNQIFKSWYMLFFQLRGLSDWTLQWQDWALIRKLWRDWSPGYILPEDYWAELRQIFEQPGVAQAMLAYYRQNASLDIFLGLRTPDALKPHSICVPTLALCGAEDGCMDARLHARSHNFGDFPAGARIETLSNAGHFLHLEQPKTVNRLILEFFTKA